MSSAQWRLFRLGLNVLIWPYPNKDEFFELLTTETTDIPWKSHVSLFYEFKVRLMAFVLCYAVCNGVFYWLSYNESQLTKYNLINIFPSVMLQLQNGDVT